LRYKICPFCSRCCDGSGLPDCHRQRPEEASGAQGKRSGEGTFKFSETGRSLDRWSHNHDDCGAHDNDHCGPHDNHNRRAHYDDHTRPDDDHDVAHHDFDRSRRPHDQHDRFADDNDGGTVTGG
jgi:hypothetical protein